MAQKKRKKKDSVTKNVTTKRNGFIWKGVRYGLALIILIWILTMFEAFSISNVAGLVLVILWLIIIIFTFIVSIMHLVKYKEKFAAIVALVISSYLILVFVISVVVGALMASQ